MINECIRCGVMPKLWKVGFVTPMPFDTIDHDILIRKLQLYKFDRKSIKWFTNYLKDRQQMVKLENGVMSKPLRVKMGVPQGSILGPFLFLIYINDLVYTLKNCDSNVTLYADDTILYSADVDIYQACAKKP